MIFAGGSIGGGWKGDEMHYDITLKYTPEFLRGMPPKELQDFLADAQQRHYELRVQTSPHGRVKDVPRPDLFGKARRDIARIKTIIAEK